MTEHASRYRADVVGEDFSKREIARRQLLRLTSPTHGRDGGGPRPTRWAHLPLADLFAQHGNALRARPDGKVETGHEPLHASKSGRCVLITPTLGRWWCRSCGRSGDAAGYMMDAHGCTYRQAAAWLAEQYDRHAADGLTKPTVGSAQRRRGRSYAALVPLTAGVTP